MLPMSKILRNTALAVLVGLASAATIMPASAHGYDGDRSGYGQGGYDNNRDSGRGWDRSDGDSRGSARGDRNRWDNGDR